VHVIIDDAEVIQCGTTVEPVCDDGEGPCGAPFLTLPVDASQVNPGVRDLVESLRPEIEKKTGTPVRSFSYSIAKPQQ
jgi:hypothetical protein